MINSAATWADGSLLAFDLETTGTDTAVDRVVTATVVSIRPGREPITRTWLADPGVEIPAESTEIHGISTEHARQHGRPAADVVAEVAAALAEEWSPDTPLCVFNAVFDLSMLHAELRRHHGRDLELGGPVVDPLCIDRHVDRYRKGKRTLGALCEHHRVRHDGAHTSTGDALAAARVAWRLARDYPAEVGQVPLDVLHTRQIEWHRTRTLGFADYLERQGRRAADPAEAAELARRAAGVRMEADHWPLRTEPLPETAVGA
ncbi:exonuclease domain-containing protein [Saccharopolyspora rosea]|uniref:exonuclease domain-containing protein n=1 Tax=Saccharopolyspora rosea TaxID=524884 RepID=UPI0021DB0105|nr:exonuclease domain-containing protein [Saccharopolyspora rosea]